MGWKSHAVKFNYRHLISSHLSSPSSSPPALESFSNPSFSLNPNPKYLIRIKSSCLNHLIDRKNLNSNLHNACRIPKPSSVFFFFLYYPIVSAKWLPFWPPKNLLSLIFNRNPNSNHFIVERSSDVNSTVSRKPFRHFLVASSLHSLSHFPEIPSFVTSDGNSRSRLFSSSSYGRNPKSGNSHRNHGSRMLKLNPDEVMEIVELIERGDDIEKSLKQMNMRLSVASISKIISLLSDRGVPVLAFFECIQKTHLDFNSNAEIYNQLINNFGSLQDYESMHALLMELSLKRHCLTEKAFGFLRVFNYNQVQESVERVLDILNRIRGSCRSSGNYMLIKVLCGLNYFDLAIFVMAGTVKKTSYYNVLIAAKCRKGDFQDASNLFVEMKRFGCDPNASSYNYLLGSLCKKGKIGEACELLEVVENSGYLPDSITFEIFVVHACRLGKMDDAIEFLHQMMLMRLKPRITTHAAFIKGYFFSRRVHDAYKYVAEMSGKDKFSSNMNYSLLASLFQKSGRVVEARDVVLQMIEEGLKPKFSVYMRVIKDLYKTGKGDLIADLKCKFSKFHSITENG